MALPYDRLAAIQEIPYIKMSNTTDRANLLVAKCRGPGVIEQLGEHYDRP